MSAFMANWVGVPLSRDLSYLFTCGSAIWALYSPKYSKNVCLTVSFGIVIVYSAIGIARSFKYFRKPLLNKALKISQKLARVVSIVMINVFMMQKTDFRDATIYSRLAFTSIPLLLNWIYYNDKDDLQRIVVMSNACSLGYMLLDVESPFKTLAISWLAFSEFVVCNPLNLHIFNETSAFNIGLGAFCLLSKMCIMEIA